MKRILSIIGVSAVVLIPVVAMAHNVGHLFLSDGTCVQIGSSREAPLVGQDKDQLDLIPSTPQDEYGASFAGVARDNLIFPGPCPAPPPLAVNVQE
jgi:hypothetical protein